jgi:diadenosine tetraphosphate (Ap4A) HIT family hydrolase
MSWSSNWEARLRGANCGACAAGRPDEDEYGVRIYIGIVSDAYLQRAPIRRGHTTVVWRGRHVAEPTELSADEAAAYWRDVLRVGAGLDEQYRPAKMNYLTLGNTMPHLHTHIVPRP